MNYYTDVLKKYAVFNGRTPRKEYWMFFLFNSLIALGISIIEKGLFKNNSTVSTLYALAVFVPYLAVSVRRLHDTNHSAWWLLINLIPIVGWVWYIVLLCTDSQASDNKYGPNPKGINTSL